MISQIHHREIKTRAKSSDKEDVAICVTTKKGGCVIPVCTTRVCTQSLGTLGSPTRARGLEWEGGLAAPSRLFLRFGFDYGFGFWPSLRIIFLS